MAALLVSSQLAVQPSDAASTLSKYEPMEALRDRGYGKTRMK
jgi:hypothetical protein